MSLPRNRNPGEYLLRLKESAGMEQPLKFQADWGRARQSRSVGAQAHCPWTEVLVKGPTPHAEVG